jgi:drug/metabolite transporter (DMT)-like permease
MTYYLAAPIYVTALSAGLLGEKVGWRRWAAVLVGFAGVLVALRPSGASLTLPALISLLGSLLFAVLMIVTRRLRGTSDAALVAWPAIGTLLFGAAVAPLDWVPPSPRDFALLSLLGVVAMLANFCVVRSLKLAPASVVVPYQYTLLVWAVVFGYLVFGDVPRPGMVVGAGLIIGAGLFIFLREQAEARRLGPTTCAEAAGRALTRVAGGVRPAARGRTRYS